VDKIMPFSYEGNQIRTVIVDDEPWFVAKDVCEVLAITWTGSQSLSRISDTHKGVRNYPTPGGNQELWCIDEAGLYKLIMRSNKEEAERFQDWVTEEVLPSIRRTGSYLQPTSLEDLIILQAKSVKELKAKVQLVEANANEAKEAAATANDHIQAVKDAIIQTDKDWRKWVNKQLQKIGFKTGDYQGIKHESYDLLERRGHCNLERRLENLKNRMRDVGSTRTQFNNANYLNVIETEPRLKEIYSSIVRELSVKHVA